MQKPNSPVVFVATVDVAIAMKIKNDLLSQGFEFSVPPHSVFSAKKKGVSCTLYASGKLTVQGKEKDAFIEFYLEPHILKTFSFSQGSLPVPSEEIFTHIGIDESGKGDFFGPLCIAGVYADEQGVRDLKALGVRDSKTLSDGAIIKLGRAIQATCVHNIIKINPQKYNELYAQFKNLNHLLAWGHATAIESLVTRTGCKTVIVDQFANENVVLTALKRKQLAIELTQRHRAEEDVVVAAASILARKTFLEGMEELGKKWDILLPKGASQATIAAGREFIKKWGKDSLVNVAKLHFKTTLVIS